MLASRPPAATDNPQLVAVGHRHLLARVNVTNTDGDHRQPLTRLDFMEPGARIAGMVHEAEIAAHFQGVDAYELASRAPSAKMHSVAIVERAVLARRPEQVHVAQILPDDFASRNSSLRHQTAHSSAQVATDSDRTAFVKPIATLSSKGAVVLRAESAASSVEAGVSFAPFFASTAKPPSHPHADGWKLPAARIQLCRCELHVIQPRLELPLVARWVR
ncbi:hypothetical protein ON010_g14257 [Phytophthora cinnamomi]|nr:hypothetical protein ON010_g14257 [Phytophthora cinnamomi]